MKGAIGGGGGGGGGRELQACLSSLFSVAFTSWPNKWDQSYIINCQWTQYSGRTSFWKMRTPYAGGREICVQDSEMCTKRNRETYTAFHRKRHTLPFTYSRMFRDRLRHILFETCWDRVPFFEYAVRIASTILRTARFLCVPYAEICINATAVNSTLHYENAAQYSKCWYVSRCLPFSLSSLRMRVISSLCSLRNEALFEHDWHEHYAPSAWIKHEQTAISISNPGFPQAHLWSSERTTVAELADVAIECPYQHVWCHVWSYTGSIIFSMMASCSSFTLGNDHYSANNALIQTLTTSVGNTVNDCIKGPAHLLSLEALNLLDLCWFILALGAWKHKFLSG